MYFWITHFSDVQWIETKVKILESELIKPPTFCFLVLITKYISKAMDYIFAVDYQT